jgi:DNA-binding NtrC family response regulator
MIAEAILETQEYLGLRAVIASPAMRRVIEITRRCAQSDATVLIEGESGSGKEVVARALHHYSRRSGGPWVDVSCATLPEHLVESELFGHERGAFSGADSKKEGLFELADGGTLFLDEIGELDPRLQVKLLRVLDCGAYYRLGGTRKVAVDVRVVAATNRDLSKEVLEGKFRKDLYHRLAGLSIQVPALRSRPEDVQPLAHLFLASCNPMLRYTDDAMEALERYPWPGNVRELRNVVGASAALAEGVWVRFSDLPAAVQAATRRDPSGTGDLLSISAALEHEQRLVMSSSGMLEAAERHLIMRVLDETNGHQQRAARILGISARTLSRKLKTYNNGTHGADDAM